MRLAVDVITVAFAVAFVDRVPGAVVVVEAAVVVVGAAVVAVVVGAAVVVVGVVVLLPQERRIKVKNRMIRCVRAVVQCDPL